MESGAITGPSALEIEARPQGSTPGRVLRRLFSFPVFLGLLLVGAVCANTFLKLHELKSLPSGHYHVFFMEGDTWWHVAVGDRIFSAHTWPESDSYSFTAQGNDWISSQWLGEVAMALAMRLGGLKALMALFIGLAGGMMLLIYYYADLRCGNAKAAFVSCALLFPLASLSFSLRPQLFGYILLLIELIVLERFRQGRRGRLWILPGVFVLWVNTHGSFVFGLAALGAYLAGGLSRFHMQTPNPESRTPSPGLWSPQQRQHLLAVALFSVLALTITPYGTRLAAYPLQMALLQPDLRSLQEWQPLPWRGFYGMLLLVLVLLFLAYLVVSTWALTRGAPTGAGYRLEDIALFVLSAYAACRHARFAIVFVIFFAPLLAGLLAHLVPQYQPQKDRYVLNVALTVLIGIGVIKFFPSIREVSGAMEYAFPQGAVQYLHRHPVPGPMFNVDYWGGYLIQSLGPQHKVFIDGRFDLYEYSGVVRDYVSIYGLHGDSAMLLRKYNVRSCLIERASPLAASLAKSPDWRQVYADGLSAVFVKR
jgi:hypothetical protein